MRDKELKVRVGIFQANWPMQPLTINAVKELVRNGYDVDVFLYNVSEKFDNLEENISAELERVRILKLEKISNTPVSDAAPAPKNEGDIETSLPKPVQSPQVSLKNRLYTLKEKSVAAFRFTFCINDLNILPPSVYQQAAQFMKGHNYKALIGVERYGLAWAGAMARRRKISLVYWSYELYTTDHPRFKKLNEYQKSKRVERKYHRRARATIIQDEDRAAVLFKDNRTRAHDVLHVPVSLLGAPDTTRSDYLHRMLGIPQDKKIILSHGMIAPWRLSTEMVIAAQEFPDEWVMVLHGPCYDWDYLDSLQKMNTKGKVIISTRNIPSSEISQLVSSAHVGLVFYSNQNMNDLLTGKSSYKVAQYAKAGIPMIVNNYPSFIKVLREFKYGRTIESMSNLKIEIEKVLSSYNDYQEKAIIAYSSIYEFSIQFKKVIDWLNK